MCCRVPVQQVQGMLHLGQPGAAPPPLLPTADTSIRPSVGTEAGMHARINLHHTMPGHETSLPILAGQLPMHAHHRHDALMSIKPGVLPLIQAGLRVCSTAERPYTPSPCAENQRSMRMKALWAEDIRETLRAIRGA